MIAKSNLLHKTSFLLGCEAFICMIVLMYLDDIIKLYFRKIASLENGTTTLIAVIAICTLFWVCFIIYSLINMKHPKRHSAGYIVFLALLIPIIDFIIVIQIHAAFTLLRH